MSRYARQPRNTDRHATPYAKRADRPFVGVDGEGGTIPPFLHQQYLLLRAGEHVLETGTALTTEECLEFLSTLPDDVVYVSYFFDYDVTMICRGLPVEKVERLLDREARTAKDDAIGCYPVDVLGGQYQIDYLPGKEFKVRKFRGVKTVGGKRRRDYHPWIVVSDTGGFFQSGFAAALDAWFPEECRDVIAKIAEGKARRNEFGAVDEYERQYNQLEIVMLAKLMERFRDTCYSLDIRPTKWQGSGNIASALFRKWGVPKKSSKNRPGQDVTVHLDYPEVCSMANASYIGGRTEPVMFGDIRARVYQYDINSAYAGVYRDLPCVLHGTWERVTAQPDGGYYFGQVTFRFDDESYNLCPLPFRTKGGRVVFPRHGSGYYASPELENARTVGAHIEWHDGYRYVNHCNCDPFAQVPALYLQRKALGKSARGRVLKIALASIYGKLAQSVGNPVYSNPIWATLITSLVRAQLYRAAIQFKGGNDVVMLATDGLFCLQERDLVVGESLGEWDLAVHDNAFVVQSGVYFLPNKDPKSRGFSMKVAERYEKELREAWARYINSKDPRKTAGQTPRIMMKQRQFTGLRMAHHMNKPEVAGRWEQEAPRRVAFEWSTKRENPQQVFTFVRTSPKMGDVEEFSVPYKKDIGKMLEETEEGRLFAATQKFLKIKLYDQPDWADS